MEKNKTVYLLYTAVIVFVLIFIGRLAHLQLFSDKYIITSENLAIRKKMLIPSRGFIFDRKGKLLVSNAVSYNFTLTYGQGFGKHFDTLTFCKLMNIKVEKFRGVLQKAKKQKSNSFILKENVQADELAYIQERIYNYPNINIENGISRDYQINSAYHILGYLSKIPPFMYTQDTTNYYNINDQVGRAGVEISYEKSLRGAKGMKYYRVDIHGNIIESYDNASHDVKPLAGEDLTLTIDYDLQRYAEDLMLNKRGAVVAIEPKTGEILALVSSPVIDPNTMKNENRTSYYHTYRNDTVFSILNNKASAGTYPPGSPFKLLVGLIALQEGIVTDTIPKYICKHGFPLSRGKKINCHCGLYYQAIRIDQAVAKSCNNFFSSAYRDILKKTGNDSVGMMKWHEYLVSFGLDSWFNNDLYEGSRGQIPTPEIYNKVYGSYAKRSWDAITTVSNAIGQGEVLMTPLQMANFTATIANKGYYFTPHIVKKIKDKPIEEFKIPKKSKINKKHFEVIIEGMKGVFDYGTARRFKSKHIQMAGKTGTSQNPHGQDHSLFVLFAPVDDPKIAIAAVIENGGAGAVYAGPIASLMAEKYLTDTIQRGALEKRMEMANLTERYQKQAEEKYEKKKLYRQEQMLKNIQKQLARNKERLDSMRLQLVKKEL